MTLVIGSIHDDRITLVADTQLSNNHTADRQQQRHDLLCKPTVKLLVVSAVLAVGVSGDLACDLTGLYKAIYSAPDDTTRTIELLRERSARFPEVFVVACLVPQPTLWRIRNGEVERPSYEGRIVIGDLNSYWLYRGQELDAHSGSARISEAQSLQQTINWFINIDSGESVRTTADRDNLRRYRLDFEADFNRTIGGYLTEVVTTPDGFRYEAHTQQTLPDRNYGTISQRCDGWMRIDARGIDHVVRRQYTLIGGPQNRRAIAFCFPPAKTGILYPDGRPWESKVYDAIDSLDTMLDRAWTEDHHVLLPQRGPEYVVGQLQLLQAA